MVKGKIKVEILEGFCWVCKNMTYRTMEHVKSCAGGRKVRLKGLGLVTQIRGQWLWVWKRKRAYRLPFVLGWPVFFGDVGWLNMLLKDVGEKF